MCAGSRCLFADHACQQVFMETKFMSAWTLTLSLLYMSVSCIEKTQRDHYTCAPAPDAAYGMQGHDFNIQKNHGGTAVAL